MGKKITAVLISLFLLCSCSVKNKEPNKEKIKEQASKPFSTGAVIKYKDIEAHASVLKDIEGSYQIEFKSPKSLEDISFFFYDTVVKVYYKDTGFELDVNSIPGNAVASMIVTAINSATAESGVNVALEDTAIIISGIMEEGEFSLHIDAKNGNFLKLDIPANQFSIEFNNFKVIE